MTPRSKILLAVLAALVLAIGIKTCADARLSHQTDTAITTADSAVGVAGATRAQADTAIAVDRAAGNADSDKQRRAAYAVKAAQQARRDSVEQARLDSLRAAQASSAAIIATQDTIIHGLRTQLLVADSSRQAAEDTVSNLRGIILRSATTLDQLRNSNATLTASIRPLEDDARKWRSKAERRLFLGACVQFVAVQTSPTVTAGPAVCYRVL